MENINPCHTFGTHREITHQLTGSIIRVNLQAGIAVSKSLRALLSVWGHHYLRRFFNENVRLAKCQQPLKTFKNIVPVKEVCLA
jgi:hypothetical protein